MVGSEHLNLAHFEHRALTGIQGGEGSDKGRAGGLANAAKPGGEGCDTEITGPKTVKILLL